MRAKKSTVAHKKHKKILKLTRGFKASRSRVFRMAKQASIRAGQYAYRDRRAKKRSMRRLWIIKINAALMPFEIKYSRFIKILKDKKIELDRKVLSQLAEFYPDEFKNLIKRVQK